MQAVLGSLVLLQYAINYSLSFLLIFAVLKALRIKTNLKGVVLISFLVSIALIVPYLLILAGVQIYLPVMVWVSYAAALLIVFLLVYAFLDAGQPTALLASLMYIVFFMAAMALIVGVFDLAISGLYKDPGLDNLFQLASDSMSHKGDSWKDWYVSHGISEERVSSFPFQKGIDKGRVVEIRPSGDVLLGDVVLYRKDASSTGYDILARIAGIAEISDGSIIGIDGSMDCYTESDFTGTFIPWARSQNPTNTSFRLYMTKADDKNETRQCSERIAPVIDSRIIGKAV